MGGHHSSQKLLNSIAKDPGHHEKEIKELFHHLDKDNSGYIDGEEIGKFVKELLEYLQKHNGDEDPDIDLFELKKANRLSEQSFEKILKRYLRDAQPHHEPQRKAPKKKEYKLMVDALVGTWKGTPAKDDNMDLPDGLSVTPLPHNTLHIIKDFMLCAHANLSETLVINKPISWKESGDGEEEEVAFLSCEYKQTIVDTAGDLVHEEVGMFVFNMEDGTASRHGVIPHGSTFIMKGRLLWEDGHVPQVPKAKTIPLANPDFKVEAAGTIFSNAYNGGLEGDLVFTNTNIPVSNPTVFFEHTNRDKDYGKVMVFDFPETKTIDLEFVDNLAKGDKESTDGPGGSDRKFIKKAQSTFWVFSDNGEEHLQYLQIIMFDFPTNVPFVVKGRIQEKENLRWPHMNIGKLTKQKS